MWRFGCGVSLNIIYFEFILGSIRGINKNNNILIERFELGVILNSTYFEVKVLYFILVSKLDIFLM